MHRWTVGETEIVRVEDEDFALPSETPVPGWVVEAGMAPDAAATSLAFTAYGIRSGGTRIVIDPWIANDHPRTRPDSVARSTRLLDELASAGFPADDIDVVVLSHFDGYGWLTRPDDEGGWRPTFPAARHLIARDELAAIRRGETLFESGHAAALVEEVAPEPVDPPLALTSAVSLEAAPGHNFGHLAVRVESGGEVAVLSGHLFVTPHAVADPSRVDGEADGAIAESSRLALLSDLAERGGVLHLPLVGGPSGGAGAVERDGAGYRLVRPRRRTD